MNLDALKNPAAYPHPVANIELIETHISIIVLTGQFAYKIKKPLNLGFLDFSTLAKRKFFCDEEIRLNRRYAPEIYLGVVAITGSYNAPIFGGDSTAIEYAVKMTQFPQTQLLDRLLDQNQLETKHIDELVTVIADFHRRIQNDSGVIPFDLRDSVYQPTLANFDAIAAIIEAPDTLQKLAAIEAQSKSAFHGLETVLSQRAKTGFVRECHGDLHLGNIALIDNRVTLFDGIEFSERLRWIDVMSELAFLIMDLEARDQPALAHRAINGYSQHTGDYDGLRVMRYYQCYRAMVRAKVAAIRLKQLEPGSSEYADTKQSFDRYMTLAESYTQPRTPWLAITMGLSGSGKTTLTEPLIEHGGAIRIRSDVERKRLFGLAERDDSESTVAGGIYTPSASSDTYEHLAELATGVLESGFPVIVDATFLQAAQRTQFSKLAEKLSIPFVILHFHAEYEVLKQRIISRQRLNNDASEATVAVLDKQIKAEQILSKQEGKLTVSIDASSVFPTELILKRVT